MSTTEHDDEEKYGCGGCQPKYLQGMNNIRSHVIWRCLLAFVNGFLVDGIINIIIVALETRYTLSSTMSGFIASSNEVGGILILLSVSYFGEHRHKPRIMAAGIFTMALGCLVFVCPHFIGGKYEYTVSEETTADSSINICQTNSSSIVETCAATRHSNGFFLYAMFVIGQILIGIGASPLSTISLSYIDENTEPKMTSFYTGWIYALLAVGAAAGYVIGGQTLRMFVDIGRVDPQRGSINPESVKTNFTNFETYHMTTAIARNYTLWSLAICCMIPAVPLIPSDSQWVGAWWIGPLISFVILLLVAFPFLGYPKRLPGYDALQQKRKSEAHCEGAEKVTARPGFGKSIKDFPRAVFLLIKNPTFVFICLAAITESLIYGGAATFGAKIIQQRFQANIATAGLIIGLIAVPGSCMGLVLGGYIVKRFNLKCRGILQFCACATAFTLLLAPIYLAKCKGKSLIGVTTPYSGQSNADGLTSPCNSRCECTTAGFEPLCVNSSVVYFSPCHAGCTGFTTDNGMKYFNNCSCLKQQPFDQHYEKTLVEMGTCGNTCFWLYIFSAFYFLITLSNAATLPPTVSALFRCVPHKQRSLALGFNLVVARLLGRIPAPVLLGTIIDSTCQVWQESCGETGSCWVYEKDDMAYKLIAWWVIIKLFSVSFYGLASKVYKGPQTETHAREETTETRPKE